MTALKEQRDLTAAGTVPGRHGLWKTAAKGPDLPMTGMRAAADGFFAEFWVPAELPELAGAACLADLETPSILTLSRARGHAGRIAKAGAEGVIIAWSADPDAGAASHAWSPAGEAPDQATWVHAGGIEGVVFSSATGFVYALGHREGVAGLTEALAAGRRPGLLARQFAGEFGAGLWKGRVGIADTCTNPLRHGQPVLEREGPGLAWHFQSFYGESAILPLVVSAPPAD